MAKTQRDLLNEVQLLLAEKRTYFSLLRTGLAVFTMPMTIIVFLIAINNLYRVFSSYVVATAVISGLAFVAMIGLLMFFQAERKLKYLNSLIQEIKSKDSRIAEMVV